MDLSRASAAILLCGFLIAGGGCQHAASSPLDLQSHLASWQGREVDLTTVAEAAELIAPHEGEESAVFDPADGLDLREVEAIALWYSPNLRVARLEAEGQLAVARSAGLLPDPEFSLEGGRKREETGGGGFMSGVPESVSSSWVSGASLSLTVPLSGRLQAEKVWRLAEFQGSLKGVMEQEWKHLDRVHDTWLQWNGAQERVRLAEEQLALVVQFADTTDQLAAIGEIDSTDARMFAIERGRMEVVREEALQEKQQLQLELFALMGLAPEAPVVIKPGFEDPHGGLPEGDRRLRIAEGHPTIVRLKAEYEATEERLRLELRRQYPDLVLSPGFSQEQNEMTWLLGTGIVVPVWNRNRQGIAEAVVARDTARARVEATYEELLSELAQLEAQLAAAQQQLRLLRDTVGPLTDQQLHEALALLHVGEASFTLMFTTLNQTHQVKQQLLDAVLDEQLAKARLHALLTPHPVTAVQAEESAP